MVEQDDVEIIVTNIINPASFLSGNHGEPVHHDCLETIEATYSSCPDLKDTPLDDTETWFTDGSSYVVSGKRHAGYAVTTCKEQHPPIYIQPVQVPLQSPPTLQQIDTHTQLGFICKFIDGRLDPLIQIINKDIKQDWTQLRSLGDTVAVEADMTYERTHYI
ncbi:hypothetical protein TURU_011371 [Turdus rufiventris]|nr:hypothetical protein TURU_011371 [Turdus rufiventris]